VHADSRRGILPSDSPAHYRARARLEDRMPIKIVDLKEMARQPKPKRTVLINGPRLHAWFHPYLQPGQKDEMHCHPGSEHIFLVFQGELHIRGLDADEDVVLRPGEFVHINQSYYYQLANETDDITVLYQVATKPAKPPKISRYSYRGPKDVDPRTLEGE
jgi:mannose-6-phosphate isomerase-like protein (cupin superfamily)